MSKPGGDLIQSCFHGDVGRRDFFNRIMKIGITGAIVSFIPSAIITKALAASAPDQNEWRRCNKCDSLFYDGYSNKGRCPGGGGHVAEGSSDYFLTYNSPGPGQPDWRFCNKCEALFYDAYPNKGVCNGGGGHVAAGFNFTLRYDAYAPGKRDWRFCNKCRTLFYTGSSNKGVCAAGQGHVAAGNNYTLDDRTGGTI